MPLLVFIEGRGKNRGCLENRPSLRTLRFGGGTLQSSHPACQFDDEKPLDHDTGHDTNTSVGNGKKLAETTPSSLHVYHAICMNMREYARICMNIQR